MATLPQGKIPGTNFTGGWVDLRVGLDKYRKSRHHWGSNMDPPAHRNLLYWLHYLGCLICDVKAEFFSLCRSISDIQIIICHLCMMCTCFGIIIHLGFLTNICIYFLKINTNIDVYLNMLTSNPVLLVHAYVGCCEVWYTFVVKVQYIIQVWSQIELALLAMFLNGCCSHAETNIQHNNHGILDTTCFNCIKNFFQFYIN